MSDPRIDGYARALLEVAQAEGVLATVQSELFAVKSNVESNEQLRNTLTDTSIPADRRQAVVENLLGAKAHAVTTQLVSFIVGSGRGRDLPAIVERLVSASSSSGSRDVAVVKSAVPLTDDQKKRLADALGKRANKTVDVLVEVDPNVMGGLVATIGDTVIDGTVRSRLDQLKSRL